MDNLLNKKNSLLKNVQEGSSKDSPTLMCHLGVMEVELKTKWVHFLSHAFFPSWNDINIKVSLSFPSLMVSLGRELQWEEKRRCYKTILAQP
jgi:hypothetical protein